MSYTEIVTSTLVSWWFFRQVPDAWTFAGVAILIGCAIAVTRRA
jgi:drug/metabolite transporter (DMT)-like permease